MRFRAAASAVLFVVGSAAMAADAPALKTDKEKLSYTVGFQIGQSLKHDGLDVDVKALGQAIQDVMSGAQPRLSMEEMQTAMQHFQEQAMAEHQALAEKNRKEGEAFLAKNRGQAGVVETKSGLQYQVIKEGTGKSPGDSDTVVVHYRGTLLDGTEFDSSYRRGEPATFPVNSVIQGWREVLPLMKEGAKWKVFVPADLAYGERGAGGEIGPNATLIFDIELLSVK